MNVTDYLAAVNPTRHQILGVELRPYSLGHKHLLTQAESPFETGGKPQEADLLLAVAICSLRWADALEFISDVKSPAVIKDWLRGIGGGAWWKRKEQTDIMSRLPMFVEYFAQGNKSPAWTVAKGGQVNEPSGTPLLADVRVFLMRELGIPEAELWDRPWALCLWDYIVAKEQLGMLRVTDPSHVAAKKAEADEIHRQLIQEGKLQ